MSKDEQTIIIQQRLKKAKETLSEVNELIPLGFYNNAVNRIYYACFYAVSAMLLQKDISPKTHSGVRHMFNLHFIQPGIFTLEQSRFYSRLFDERQTSDYEDFAEFQKETVEELFSNAKDFLQSVENILMSENE